MMELPPVPPRPNEGPNRTRVFSLVNDEDGQNHVEESSIRYDVFRCVTNSKSTK